MNTQQWRPLADEKLEKIRQIFTETYPEEEYGDLAGRITEYWISKLRNLWDTKDEEIKKLDVLYNPEDPLSRIHRHVLAISYADSMKDGDIPTLRALGRFVKEYFPALGGLHILPACSVSEERFNDGYFSQINRSQVHKAFGTNEMLAKLMKDNFSMNDFVLNHVDIENPLFQAFLEGDDDAGRAFFIFREDEYIRLRDSGSFDNVFRPRPFPLFSIYRRLPADTRYREKSQPERLREMKSRVKKETSLDVPEAVLNLLYIFDKIKNDQMLLEEDYKHITAFIDYIPSVGLSAETFFTRSKTQEVQHYPYVFTEDITTDIDFLMKCGYGQKEAEDIARSFAVNDGELFGEKIRALTTFSHVQVDINLTAFEGLKLLIDDLSFYLSMDLNLLRFDAVNYGFKKWGTSCFGLPEINNIMNIIYLSMESVSPRIVPNLEVNDSLTTILRQMSNKESAPPMMHDFHLVSMLPIAFHLENPAILKRIRPLIERFEIPDSSIRFSLSESHDGKSVRGSMDLLTLQERQILAKKIVEGGGKIKFKSSTIGKIHKDEFIQFCKETGLDYDELVTTLFEKEAGPDGNFQLKPDLRKIENILSLCPSFAEPDIKDSADYLLTKIVEGREPYELCCTTRNSLTSIPDTEHEVRRYLSFHTLAFAMMGRNVKTIYFNDLIGLPNDTKKYEDTGELRNIKRTKSELSQIKPRLDDESSFEAAVSKGINNLIALVDADKALHYRGGEALVMNTVRIDGPESEAGPPVAAVYNGWGDHHSLTVVNVSANPVTVKIPLEPPPFEGGALAARKELYDNFSGKTVTVGAGGVLELELEPFGRLWLSAEKIDVDPAVLR